MTLSEQLILIAMVSLGTMVMRFLPFLIFPAGRPTPKYIQYLGKVLPGAVFGMLVIYCLKGVSFADAPYGIPELLGCAAAALLHIWKRNTLLSIGLGTLFYMLLVQFVF